MVVNHPIKNFGKAEKALGRKVFRDTVKASIRAAAPKAILILRRRSVEKNIRYKYRFAQGWRARFSGWEAVTVYNRAKHAPHVEYGRGKHRRPPPTKPIEAWLRHKGKKVVSAKTVGGIRVVKRGGRSSGPRGKELKRIAYLVARSIGRRGIKARPVLTESKTSKAVSKVFFQGVSKGLDRACKIAYKRSAHG